MPLSERWQCTETETVEGSEGMRFKSMKQLCCTSESTRVLTRFPPSLALIVGSISAEGISNIHCRISSRHWPSAVILCCSFCAAAFLAVRGMEPPNIGRSWNLQCNFQPFTKTWCVVDNGKRGARAARSALHLVVFILFICALHVLLLLAPLSQFCCCYGTPKPIGPYKNKCEVIQIITFAAHKSSTSILPSEICRRVSADLPPRPYLSDLAVSFKFRRRGVGTALVRACERACQAWGYQSVFLKVEAENRAGLALYRALGYVEALPPDAKNQILLSRTLGPGLEADMLLPPPQTPLQSTPASASSLSLLSSPAGTGAGGGTVLVSGGGGSSSSSISDSGGASIGGSGGDGAATIHEPAESLVAVAGMAAAIAAGLPPEDMGPFCRL
ncbi:unnamed protein product [Phaeothamnion confervicola]